MLLCALGERLGGVEGDHIGSAHTDAELTLLVNAARDLLHEGQASLDLGVLDQAQVIVDDVADWTRPGNDVVNVPRRSVPAPSLEATRWCGPRR
mgnify:CR=1 FL=1